MTENYIFIVFLRTFFLFLKILVLSFKKNLILGSPSEFKILCAGLLFSETLCCSVGCSSSSHHLYVPCVYAVCTCVCRLSVSWWKAVVASYQAGLQNHVSVELMWSFLCSTTSIWHSRLHSSIYQQMVGILRHLLANAGSQSPLSFSSLIKVCTYTCPVKPVTKDHPSGPKRRSLVAGGL